MSNGHGGARPGAGRPRNTEKYAEAITSFHDAAADAIQARYRALTYLADGGFDEEAIEEVWEPAGLIQITKELITEDGRSVNVKELAFPHLPPEQLVCVQRKVKKQIAAPDLKANIYLVDRVAGKPTQATELSGPDGGAIELNNAAMETAARELTAWREQMSTQLSSLNVPPMPRTSLTPTE